MPILPLANKLTSDGFVKKLRDFRNTCVGAVESIHVGDNLEASRFRSCMVDVGDGLCDLAVKATQALHQCSNLSHETKLNNSLASASFNHLATLVSTISQEFLNTFFSTDTNDVDAPLKEAYNKAKTFLGYFLSRMRPAENIIEALRDLVAPAPASP